jgi:hypothetical protein
MVAGRRDTSSQSVRTRHRGVDRTQEEDELEVETTTTTTATTTTTTRMANRMES